MTINLPLFTGHPVHIAELKCSSIGYKLSSNYLPDGAQYPKDRATYTAMLFFTFFVDISKTWQAIGKCPYSSATCVILCA